MLRLRPRCALESREGPTGGLGLRSEMEFGWDNSVWNRGKEDQVFLGLLLFKALARWGMGRHLEDYEEPVTSLIRSSWNRHITPLPAGRTKPISFPEGFFLWTVGIALRIGP